MHACVNFEAFYHDNIVIKVIAIYTKLNAVSFVVKHTILMKWNIDGFDAQLAIHQNFLSIFSNCIANTCSLRDYPSIFPCQTSE